MGPPPTHNLEHEKLQFKSAYFEKSWTHYMPSDPYLHCRHSTCNHLFTTRPKKSLTSSNMWLTHVPRPTQTASHPSPQKQVEPSEGLKLAEDKTSSLAWREILSVATWFRKFLWKLFLDVFAVLRRLSWIYLVFFVVIFLRYLMLSVLGCLLMLILCATWCMSFWNGEATWCYRILLKCFLE